MPRFFMVVVLAVGMAVWASCDTEPPLPDPPSFNGASTSRSFVARLELTATAKGSGTQKASQTIEYVAPNRVRVRQTGFELLPASAVVIGDEVWPLLTPDKRSLLLQWYSNIAWLEEGLTAGNYNSAHRGPRVRGEQTNRYVFTRENIYGSLVASNEYIEEAERVLRDVDASFEVLVGIETGRIYRVDFRAEGTYSVTSARLELTDFDTPIRIDPPAVSPSR
jgi:hypothetical protein